MSSAYDRLRRRQRLQQAAKSPPPRPRPQHPADSTASGDAESVEADSDASLEQGNPIHGWLTFGCGILLLWWIFGNRFDAIDVMSYGDGHDWVELTSDQKMEVARTIAEVSESNYGPSFYFSALNSAYDSPANRDTPIAEFAISCATTGFRDF